MLSGFLTVAGMTLIAKAVSFLKDAGIAHRYGISDELDAFNVAFGVMNFSAILVGVGLPSSMIPVYAQLDERRGSWRAERFALQTSFVHFGSLLLIVGVLCLLSGPLSAFMCAGFPEAKRALTQRLLIELTPFLLCYGLSLHFSHWLRGKLDFAVAAVAPALTPLLTLLVIYTRNHDMTVQPIVLGTNLGSFLTVVVLAYRLRERLPKQQRWWNNALHFWEPALRPALTGAGPFVLSGVLIGSAPLIDQAMATPLASGSVSALGYSDKVCSIILALTATAAADTLFPFFSQLVAKEDWRGLRRRLIHTTATVLGVALPMVVLLIWQAPLVVKLLFERGEFLASDTQQVAEVLRLAALQIPFYIASVLMSRVVVSLRANSFTLVVTSIALINNVVFNRLFMVHWGAAGIALSTAIVYLFSCIVLFAFLQRRITGLIASQEVKR